VAPCRKRKKTKQGRTGVKGERNLLVPKKEEKGRSTISVGGEGCKGEKNANGLKKKKETGVALGKKKKNQRKRTGVLSERKRRLITRKENQTKRGRQSFVGKERDSLPEGSKKKRQRGLGEKEREAIRHRKRRFEKKAPSASCGKKGMAGCTKKRTQTFRKRKRTTWRGAAEEGGKALSLPRMVKKRSTPHQRGKKGRSPQV